MPSGSAFAMGTVNSLMMPVVVIRPTLFPADSVNHRLPSGPAAIPCGALSAVGIGNSVICPSGVILPIALPTFSVNQTLPSEPSAMPQVDESVVGVGYSTIGNDANAAAGREALPSSRPQRRQQPAPSRAARARPS